MSKKIELNLEELEEVIGGVDNGNSSPSIGKKIDKYDASQYVDTQVYVKSSLPGNNYGIGILRDSTEKDRGLNRTLRCHLIDFSEMHGQLMRWSDSTRSSSYISDATGEYWIDGDRCTLYEYN